MPLSLTQHLFHVNTYSKPLAALDTYNKTLFNEFILKQNQTTSCTYPAYKRDFQALPPKAWQRCCCPCYPFTFVTAWGISLHGSGHIGSMKRALLLQRVRLAGCYSSSRNGMGFIALPALSLKITQMKLVRKIYAFQQVHCSNLYTRDLLTQHRNIFIIGTGCHHPVHKGHPKPDRVSLLCYLSQTPGWTCSSSSQRAPTCHFVVVHSSHLFLCV